MISISSVSIGFDGFSLNDTLKGLSKTISKNIIISCIDGFTKHYIPEDHSIDEWMEVKELIKSYNLNFTGLFGHCNISVDDDLEKMKKRMLFTSKLGGKSIDTNSGPKGTENNFYKNINSIINLAEDLNLFVYLETHGDLIVDGKSGAKLLSRVESDRIKISYDPANVTFINNNKVNVIDDLKNSLEYIGSIHLKGVKYDSEKDIWEFPRLIQSMIDYEKLFSVLIDNNYDKDIALEIEDHLKIINGKIYEEPKRRSFEEIISAYNNDLNFIYDKLGLR